eukprot:g4562.t1
MALDVIPGLLRDVYKERWEDTFGVEWEDSPEFGKLLLEGGPLPGDPVDVPVDGAFKPKKDRDEVFSFKDVTGTLKPGMPLKLGGQLYTALSVTAPKDRPDGKGPPVPGKVKLSAKYAGADAESLSGTTASKYVIPARRFDDSPLDTHVKNRLSKGDTAKYDTTALNVVLLGKRQCLLYPDSPSHVLGDEAARINDKVFAKHVKEKTLEDLGDLAAAHVVDRLVKTRNNGVAHRESSSMPEDEYEEAVTLYDAALDFFDASKERNKQYKVVRRDNLFKKEKVSQDATQLEAEVAKMNKLLETLEKEKVEDEKEHNTWVVTQQNTMNMANSQAGNVYGDHNEVHQHHHHHYGSQSGDAGGAAGGAAGGGESKDAGSSAAALRTRSPRSSLLMNHMKDFTIRLKDFQIVMDDKYKDKRIPQAKVLGQGSAGRVLAAKYENWRTKQVENCAYKEFVGEFDPQDSRIKEFVQELQFMSQHSHPYIIRFMGLCVEQEATDRNGFAFGFGYLMPRVQLGSLQDVLYFDNRSSRPLYHCDLKAANCLVQSLEPCKILLADFGKVSTSMSYMSVRRDVGGIRGTHHYSSPQRFVTEPELLPYNHTDDIYSYGIVLYELCGRKGPWGEELTETQVSGKMVMFNEITDYDEELEEDAGWDIDKQRERWNKKHPLASRRPPLHLLEEGCPDILRSLMQDCWVDESYLRPTFDKILERLGGQEDDDEIDPEFVEQQKARQDKAQEQAAKNPDSFGMIIGPGAIFIKTLKKEYGVKYCIVDSGSRPTTIACGEGRSRTQKVKDWVLKQIDTCDKEFMENQNAMKMQAETAERIQQTKRRPPESYYEDGLRKPPHQLEPDHVGYHRPPRRRGPPYYLCGDMKYRGECPRGNECTFAHSLEEKKRWVMDFGRVESKAMYDEDVCRRIPDANSFDFDSFTMCFNFDCEQGCSYGLNCNFAHSEAELKAWNRELAALHTEREMAAHPTVGDYIDGGNDRREADPATAVEEKLLQLIRESRGGTVKCNQILDQYKWRFREQLDFRGAGHEKLSGFLKTMPRITYDASGGLGYESFVR